MSGPVTLGVIGLGYWGPNLARNFDGLPDAELTWICDGSAERLERTAERFPRARATTDPSELLADAALDAVAVATPVPTHADLARQVLEAGKHCFVEKPLAQSVSEAEEVVEAERRAGRTLMVGHLLEYHPGLEHLKQLVGSGELGQVRYIYGNRLNLGKLRAEENALWSLGAHDVSVLLGGVDVARARDVLAVALVGLVEALVVDGELALQGHVVEGGHLPGADDREAALLVRVEPRQVQVGGQAGREAQVAEDHVLHPGLHVALAVGVALARLLSGEPQISNEEPLRIECRHFVDRIRDGARPRSDVAAGVRVVRVLEELQRSLDAGS